MKIAFDHTIFLIQKYGGISRYFLEVQKKFLIKHDVKICCPIYLNEFIKKKSNNNLNFFKIDKIPKYNTRLLNYINYKFNDFYFSKWQPNIIHKTYFNDYKYSHRKAKNILNVWDLSHEIYHYMYNQPENWRPKKKALDQTDHVICSSIKTKNDLIKFYSYKENKISVIYQGTPILNKSDINLKLNFKFFLYVGSRKKYKNFKTVIKAFALKKNILSEFKLVCFGNEPLNKDEIELINSLDLNQDDIIIYSGNDNILYNLYKRAEALIYPSLNEGFGFPPLEAMNSMCPVIVSNNQAIYEAVGNCGIYFNPKNAHNLLNCIEKVIDVKFNKKLLLEKGIERSKKFNWNQTSLEIEKVYKKVLDDY